jgi:hypothetical protein
LFCQGNSLFHIWLLFRTRPYGKRVPSLDTTYSNSELMWGLVNALSRFQFLGDRTHRPSNECFRRSCIDTKINIVSWYCFWIILVQPDHFLVFRFSKMFNMDPFIRESDMTIFDCQKWKEVDQSQTEHLRTLKSHCLRKYLKIYQEMSIKLISHLQLAKLVIIAHHLLLHFFHLEFVIFK